MDQFEGDQTAEVIARRLPLLRRHARMLLGRQAAADQMVMEALEAFGRAPGHNLDREAVTIGLFRALYEALRSRSDEAAETEVAADREGWADARLRSLSPDHRAVLLLTAVEELAIGSVAAILGASPETIEQLADEAQILIERELATSVLIIEDEWVIARDLRRIVGELGHEVAGIAGTRSDAVAAAKRHRPGLVLADLQLADGSSGADAVRDIFADEKTPTIFVTAFPERLLTGERPEPTYLITKPYSPAMIQATISQALFFSGRA